jgi:hypothetical protein
MKAYELRNEYLADKAKRLMKRAKAYDQEMDQSNNDFTSTPLLVVVTWEQEVKSKLLESKQACIEAAQHCAYLMNKEINLN